LIFLEINLSIDPVGMKYVLAIAGSDSSGGAGIQADIKTITALGAHALTVITALTAQNSTGIDAIQRISARFISNQVRTVVEDIRPHAIKVGMLATAAAVKGVVALVKRFKLAPLVIDPVLKASTGGRLLEAEAVSVLRDELFPLAEVVTPNLAEASTLSGRSVETLGDMEWAAKAIQAMGPKVVIKGGHLAGDCVDILYDGSGLYRFGAERIRTRHTHGTGCVFSSALATYLALGHDVIEATRRAHAFTRQSIAQGYPCGSGAGVTNPSPATIKA
jgi:hydroxymethylpyrimidine/phosphomethylpyrimidine kinase